MSVCERGWRSSFVGVGLSMDESPKDCVQRGALEAVVRRRPLILRCGASTGVAAVVECWPLTTDAVANLATMLDRASRALA